MSRYYLIWPLNDVGVTEDKEWLKEYLARHSFCCGHEDESFHPPVVLVSDYGCNVPLSFGERTSIEFIRNDLRQSLSPEIDEAIDFGAAEHISGTSSSMCHTYWGRNPTWLRSGMRSWCYRCKTCGQILYSPIGSWYVVKNDLPPSPVFSTHMGGIVVHDSVLSRVVNFRSRLLSIKILPVYEAPRDGFPNMLSEIDFTQERRPPWSQQEVTRD